jgi:copper homeostasis protein
MADRRAGRILLEIIACSVEDARNAEAGGADRLEVTRALDNDGLTPCMEVVERIRQAVSIPVHVMIRSRNAFSGFSAKEIDSMQEELRVFKRAGVDGVAVGFLSRDREIDFETTGAVLKEAQPLSVTFHRAFDHVRDHRQALTELLERNVVHRVLTSGGASSAVEGKDVLADLFRVAKGRVALIAGGGVTAENLPLLVRHTGLREYHAGRSVRTPPAHDGIVDPQKVLHLAMVAKTLSEEASTIGSDVMRGL